MVDPSLFSSITKIVSDYPVFKVLVVDLDGTLVDTMDVHRNGYLYIFSKRGWRFDNEIWTKEGPMGGSKWLSKILAKNGVSKPSLVAKNVKRQKTKWFLDNLNLVKPMKGVLEAVLWVKKQYNCKLVCATTALSEVAYGILEKLDLFDIFDLILTANDIPGDHLKPDPFIYNLVLEKTRQKPTECLVIEDSSIGVQAALSAKISCYNVIENHFYMAKV